MTSDQRRNAVKKFNDAPCASEKVLSKEFCELPYPVTQYPATLTLKSNMSLESEDCGITTLSQASLDSIWSKALYVLLPCDVAALGGDPKAKNGFS